MSEPTEAMKAWRYQYEIMMRTDVAASKIYDEFCAAAEKEETTWLALTPDERAMLEVERNTGQRTY